MQFPHGLLEDFHPQFREAFENEISTAFNAYSKQEQKKPFSHYLSIAESLFLQQLQKKMQGLQRHLPDHLVLAGLFHGILDKSQVYSSKGSVEEGKARQLLKQYEELSPEKIKRVTAKEAVKKRHVAALLAADLIHGLGEMNAENKRFYLGLIKNHLIDSLHRHGLNFLREQLEEQTVTSEHGNTVFDLIKDALLKKHEIGQLLRKELESKISKEYYPRRGFRVKVIPGTVFEAGRRISWAFSTKKVNPFKPKESEVRRFLNDEPDIVKVHLNVPKRTTAEEIQQLLHHIGTKGFLPDYFKMGNVRKKLEGKTVSIEITHAPEILGTKQTEHPKITLVITKG